MTTTNLTMGIFDFAARFQRANLPCMKVRPRERPIPDSAQPIKWVGLIMNGSKDDRSSPGWPVICQTPLTGFFYFLTSEVDSARDG